MREAKGGRSTKSLLVVGNFLSDALGTRGICEELAKRLPAYGWSIVTTSRKRGRAVRLLDMLATAFNERERYSVAYVDVYSGLSFFWAEAVCFLLRRLGKPYVLALRGGLLPEFATRWPGRVEKLLNSAAAVTTPSYYLLDKFKPFCTSLRLLPNGLDMEAYEFRQRLSPQPKLVWLRAFHNIYNPSLAPRFLARLTDEFPDVHLTMIGPDKGDGSLQITQKVAEDLGVFERINWPGQISKTDVSAWMNTGDVFVNTTDVDGNAPVTVLEAMACGLCVVSTAVGGIPYLLEHERDALLVPPDDPEAMAHSVRRVLTDLDLAGESSIRARRKVERFDWKSVLPQWNELLTCLIDKRVLLVGNFLSEFVGTRGVCEELAERLPERGWSVITTSEKSNRLSRLADMLRIVWMRRHVYSVAYVDVYSGLSFFWAEAVCWMLKLLRKPVVLALRGGRLPEFAARWPKRVSRLLETSSITVAPSHYLLKEMAPYCDGLRLLPNPLDLKNYPFTLRSHPRPRLVWLRAFHSIYNPALVAKSLSLLAERFPDVRLIMVGPDKGDGSLQEMQRMAEKLGVLDRIEVPGRVSKIDVPDWMNKGDIFINSTNVDNAPVSVLEAMACGLCIVSTKVGGIPYLLSHEEDALLVSPDHPEEMAYAIERLLSDTSLAARLSECGRRKAEEFDWSIILPAWEMQISKAANAGREAQGT